MKQLNGLVSIVMKHTLSVFLLLIFTFFIGCGGSGGGGANTDAGTDTDNNGNDIGGDSESEEVFVSGFVDPKLDDDSYADEGIFISPSGSDASGDGAIDAPYKTIQYVLDNIATSGSTLILREGSYEEAIRIRQSDITIRSKHDEWAKIITPIDDSSISATVIIDVDADNTKLQRIEIEGGYYYGIMHFTRWDWGDSEDRGGPANVVLEKIIVHDTGRDAIKITPGTDYVTIRGSEIYNSGQRDDSNADGIDNVNGDHFRLQDSYIHDTGTTGVYCKGGAIDCVIERTRITDTGAAGILIGFDTSPEFFDLDVNPSYYENIEGIVRNCIISRTQWAGIGLYGAKDAKVYNNTIIDSAQTYHTPIYFGLTYQDWDDEAGRPPSINPIIRNNLIYQSTGYSPSDQFVYIRYSNDLGGMSALSGMPAMSNNLYFREEGAGQFQDRRPDSLFAGTITEWQAHTSADQASIENDPLFGNEYRLTGDSPAIDNGYDLGVELNYDFYGDERGQSIDIGAEEFR